MEILSADDWEQVLKAIAKNERHRLTGSEYKQLVQVIEAHPRDARNIQQACRLVAALADHQGAGTQPPFNDPYLNKVYQVESSPVAPQEGDERLRERVIAGTTVFRSREFGHTAAAGQLDQHSTPGRAVSASRLDVVHKPTDTHDTYDVYLVKTQTHIPYGSGLIGKPIDQEKTLHGNFHSLKDACKSIDDHIGIPRHSELIRQRQEQYGIHWKEAPPPIRSTPKP